MNKPTHLYIAYKPCGCPVGSCAYNFQLRSTTAQVLKEWVLKGYIIQSFKWNEIELPELGCTHGEVIADHASQPTLF